ncbi:MAG TPA: beta-mannanase [Planctomycetes bacterium]|nr:beta-mannanase [Planctomycetota bacterium]
MTMTILDLHGGFRRKGASFVPMGANYWPGSCGVEMLQAWPSDEIRRDLDLAAALGLNTIRYFARWDHLEPRLGSLDQRMVGRIAEFAGWCGERGLLAHPCLFVGFMSGGHFWPQGMAGRNPFSDPFLIERGAALVQAVAEHLRPHADHLLALDLGNEPSAIDAAASAGPVATAAWCSRMVATAKAALPGLLVCVGNDQNQVVGDRGWPFTAQADCDFLSMHGYPVPGWHPIPFDGMADPLAGDLLPAYTACARAFGPVLVQEFGTIIGNGPERMRVWLERTLDGCRAAGANGFLWWCLRDITARCHPYAKGGFEQRLGLLDAQGRPRPGTEPFWERLRTWSALPCPPPLPCGEVAIYWPASRDRRDPVTDVGNTSEALGQRLLSCWHALRTAGYAPVIARHDQTLPDLPLVNPGAAVGIDEARRLVAWVRQGGRLLWHGIDHATVGEDMEALLVARPIDHRLPQPVELPTAAGPVRCAAYPRQVCLEMDPGPAEVLARDPRGIPLAALSANGAGRILWSPALLDAAGAEPCNRLALAAWYREALARLI